jgi:hypothetical protein
MNIKQTRFICLLILSLSLPASFAYVMGLDDRLEVGKSAEQSAEVAQTGMISIRGEQFVSGVLTGENCDVVISAGHAAIHWETVARKGWRKGELRGGGDFRFNLDPKTGLEWQTMTLVSSGYELEENIDEDKHDWSIFRLSKRALPDCENIKIIPNRSDCPGEVIMPGFHFDKPETKLVDNSCSIKRSSGDGVVVHDCDSKDGSSGAPLFCRDNDRSALLAINISGLTRKDYFDAGVYGKAGLNYHVQQHKNFAINISGAFYKALMKELLNSKARSFLKD